VDFLPVCSARIRTPARYPVFERIAPLRRVLIKNKLKKIEKGQILPDYPMVLPNGQVVDK
jgi:hypothetical protein